MENENPVGASSFPPLPAGSAASTLMGSSETAMISASSNEMIFLFIVFSFLSFYLCKRHSDHTPFKASPAQGEVARSAGRVAHRTSCNLSLRASDRCHWCGNPFSPRRGNPRGRPPHATLSFLFPLSTFLSMVSLPRAVSFTARPRAREQERIEKEQNNPGKQDGKGLLSSPAPSA